jgi:uncharacterized LabA/DUF88 family protein
MENTIVFIDAGYLSFISKYFGKGKPIKYKIENFANNLAVSKNLECKKIYFYTAPHYQSKNSTKEENKRKANYDKFLFKLKKSKPQIIIREGRCQKINNNFYQKGVDTLITIDLSRIPKKEEVKKVILITSDTDFVPIIKDLKEEGIKVILAYFTDKKRKSAFSLSNHLWKVCSEKLLIKQEHFS